MSRPISSLPPQSFPFPSDKRTSDRPSTQSSHSVTVGPARARTSDTADSATTALHWFRRGLRFHDNPALVEALGLCDSLKCIYILDPATVSEGSQTQVNKWRFLLECLADLDTTLRKHHSRLYVLRGQPTLVLPALFKEWRVNILSLEEDPTPHGARRDKAIEALADAQGVCVIKKSSHTLHPLSKLIELGRGRYIGSFKKFAVVFREAGKPVHHLDSVPFDLIAVTATNTDPSSESEEYSVPSLDDLGLLGGCPADAVVWKGGETEALKRLAYHLERRAWVACFDSPKIDSKSLMPAPGALGPYLNFGCLSPRLLYWKIDALYKQVNRTIEDPPISLHGHLMLRDYYYVAASLNEHFDRVQGNQLCLQIPWKKTDVELMSKVFQASTGFPWIDAIIRQLISEGWIHGIAKHALISFITHGQLFFSWEEAANLLDEYCLDGDICTNNGVAMMLSGSTAGQSQPLNIVSPVLSGQTIDNQADFIRHYLPLLKSYPSEYIYEPWTAPLDVQQKAGCVVGQDYRAPIMDHYHTLHTNLLTLQEFLNSVRHRRAVSKKRRRLEPCHMTSSSNQIPWISKAPRTETHYPK